MRLRFSALILGGIFLLLPHVSFAMKLDPDSSDLWVNNGESGVATIFVENDSKVEKEYELQFFEVSFGENAEDLSFVPLSANESTWFSANPTHFGLLSGDNRQVDVTVSVPVENQLKTKTIAVVVKEQNTEEGIAISSAATSLLFLHLGENGEWRMEIVSFSAKVIDRHAILELVLKNTGDDVGVITGEVRVRNMFGKIVDRFPITEAPKRVPPGTFRGTQLIWPKDNAFSPLLAGKYTFEYVENDTVIARANASIYSPLSIWIIVLAILSIVLGILLTVRRLRR